MLFADKLRVYHSPKKKYGQPKLCKICYKEKYTHSFKKKQNKWYFHQLDTFAALVKILAKSGQNSLPPPKDRHCLLFPNSDRPGSLQPRDRFVLFTATVLLHVIPIGILG